jgi:hypothetical protein
MIASMKSLTPARNDHAHTHISGTTPAIIAPSVTKQYFIEIHDDLMYLNKELKRIKF